MRLLRKELIIRYGEIKTPPLSEKARIEAGGLLRKLQGGFSLSMPHSRPMPSIGERCHELRLNDKAVTWRIFYRIDADAVIVVEVLNKKTEQTPPQTIKTCQKRFKQYDEEVTKKEGA